MMFDTREASHPNWTTRIVEDLRTAADQGRADEQGSGYHAGSRPVTKTVERCRDLSPLAFQAYDAGELIPVVQDGICVHVIVTIALRHNRERITIQPHDRPASP